MAVAWLLSQHVCNAFDVAIAAGLTPSFEQQTEYEARYYSEGGPSSRVMSVAGDVAEISVSGVITQKPDLLAMLFGGGNVTYADIIKALATAEADPAVKRVEMRIESPGGQFDGLFDAIAAIQAFTKPLKAVVHNQAASAAYALAAACGEIVAANYAARFGSVGVVGGFGINPNRVEITSTKAPKKRPDVTTPEGVAVVREELDALHDIFVDTIAAGRKTTPAKVNANYGQGATLLAGEALKRGMIDAVAGPKLRAVPSAVPTTSASTGGDNLEAINMDLITLRTTHPAVYAEAVAEGVTKERERVEAHLIAGEMSGDIGTAVKHARDGSEMTTVIQTKYLMTAANRRDIAAHKADDEAVAAATAAASTVAAEDAESLQVLAALREELGITAEVK